MRGQIWKCSVCGLALVAFTGCELKPQELLQNALGAFANGVAMSLATELTSGMDLGPMTTTTTTSSIETVTTTENDMTTTMVTTTEEMESVTK